MQVKDYWKVSSLLLMSLLLSSCSTWNPLKTVEVQTIQVERQIPTQNRPPQIQMNTTMKWWVVTEENFKEFKAAFQKENGDPLVAYVISVKDYETLALNMAEIKRYIEQQKSIIVYYEEAIKPQVKEKETK
jgi:PHD/YefM family antitoxin component YafN of YafNO toxin-antitoxin module